MNTLKAPHYWLVGLIFMAAGLPSIAAVEEGKTIELGEGKLKLTAPADWQKKEPANKIIQYEFAAKAAKGDPADGRITVTSASGTVEANMDRWIGQFTQPDGSKSKDKAKVSQRKTDGLEVHLLDISGTYIDKPPFAPGPGIERPNYRMLAAIIPTKEAGSYFIKFYGPQKTVADNEKIFNKFVDSLQQK